MRCTLAFALLTDHGLYDLALLMLLVRCIAHHAWEMNAYPIHVCRSSRASQPLSQASRPGRTEPLPPQQSEGAFKLEESI